MKISEVAAKVAAGEDIVTAGYEYLDDQTVITTKDLTGKATADIVAIAAAVIGAIAGILGMAGKSKGAFIMGIVTVVAAAAALVLTITKESTNMVLAASAISAVMALILVVVSAKNKAPAAAKTDTTGRIKST
jgi:peptidoglycan/LPS O-acetylase OafA/YrhL